MSARLRPWMLTFLVVLVACQAAVGMRASQTASITGDEPFYLLTTQSLASDGDLDLRDEYREREYERFWDGDRPLWRQMEPTADGRLLSPHSPGLSLLVLPAYQWGGLRGAQRFLVVVWAAAMALATVLARRAQVPPWAAVLGAVAVGAGAPGLVYASQVYPEAPAALAVAVAAVVATGHRPRPWLLVLAVVALAWLGVRYVPIGLVLAGAWAWRFRAARGAVVLAVAAVAVAAAHYLWWHLDTFGALTPYATNVVWAGEGTGELLGDHVRLRGRSYRLYGLFLDARFGLFRWLPAAVLAATATHLLRRHDRRPVLALAAGVLATAVLVATFASITMMGWWFPARMLVAAVPALVVLIAAGTARLPRTAVALTGWSLAISAALAWSAHSGGVRLAVDPFALGWPLAPAWLFPDFRSFGWPEIIVSLLWGGALTMLAWRSFSSSTATPSPIEPSSPSPPISPPLRAR